MGFTQTIANGEISPEQWQELIASMTGGDGLLIDSDLQPVYEVKNGEIGEVTELGENHGPLFYHTPQPWHVVVGELVYKPEYEGMLVFNPHDKAFWYCKDGIWDRIHKPKETKTDFIPSFRQANWASIGGGPPFIMGLKKTAEDIGWEDRGSAVVVRELGEMKEVTVQIRGNFNHQRKNGIVEFGLPEFTAPSPMTKPEIWMSVTRTDGGDGGDWMEAELRDGHVTPLQFTVGKQPFFDFNVNAFVEISYRYLTSR